MQRDSQGRFLPAYLEDPFDPRGWAEPLPYRTLWLRPELGVFCIVDAVDYDWCLQWAWSATPNSTGLKWYATRSTRLNGRAGRNTKIYLHKEIMQRASMVQPSPKHHIGDHKNGESLDCRRVNLRYATPSMNAQNIDGAFARQLQMAL